MTPELPAFADRVTLPVELVPPATDVGVKVKDRTVWAKALTFAVAITNPRIATFRRCAEEKGRVQAIMSFHSTSSADRKETITVSYYNQWLYLTKTKGIQ